MGCYLGGRINIKALRGRFITLPTDLHQLLVLRTRVTDHTSTAHRSHHLPVSTTIFQVTLAQPVLLRHLYQTLSALTLWVGWQEGHPVKNGRWSRWALVSPDGVAPSRIVSVSASVNLPLHHKVQKFFSGTGLPGWSRKNGRKTVVVWWLYQTFG